MDAGLAKIDWERVAQELDERGCATTGVVLERGICDELARGYGNDAQFRSKVVMARHGFGRGEYKYFAYPLPEIVQRLRTELYPRCAAVANGWQEKLGLDKRFPREHGEYLKLCHAAGQTQPTPLLLKYGADDYNCLHRDLYGDLVFPLQVAFLLSTPGENFTGGEFVLTEQRPRMQSRVEVVPLRQGEGVIFAVNERPVRGTKGVYRVGMRHGVSRLRSGQRFTMGIIFHDAL